MVKHSKSDITSKSDIELLVNTFYDRLLNDKLLSPIFQSTILSELDKHLDTISAFWTGVLLQPDNYQGNIILKHIELNKIHPLNDVHFETWIRQWNETVDHLYKGENAELAKSKAMLMKQIMQVKIKNSQNLGFIQ